MFDGLVESTLVGPAEGFNDGLPDGLLDGDCDGNNVGIGVEKDGFCETEGT